ncbi:MAG: histidine phosphatase family protein [Candidatus Saccharibacteria bacterium]
MIYFIRHGESEANVANVFSGPDSLITYHGREQARVAGEKLKSDGIVIDRIISSTYQRASETAVVIANMIGFDIDKIQYDHRLVEINCGELTYKSRDQYTELQMLGCDGAEDIYKFQERVMKSFNEIKNLPGNTLIVSHAGVERIISVTTQGLPLMDLVRLPEYPNATVVELD